MKVHVRPRIQKDKWSLYWRTSMSTVTEVRFTRARAAAGMGREREARGTVVAGRFPSLTRG